MIKLVTEASHKWRFFNKTRTVILHYITERQANWPDTIYCKIKYLINIYFGLWFFFCNISMIMISSSPVTCTSCFRYRIAMSFFLFKYASCFSTCTIGTSCIIPISSLWKVRSPSRAKDLLYWINVQFHLSYS